MTEIDPRVGAPMRNALRRRRFYSGGYVSFALPPLESAADLIEASKAVIVACASGRLTVPEAVSITSLIARHAKLIELVDLKLNANKKCEPAEPEGTSAPPNLITEEMQAMLRSLEADPKNDGPSSMLYEERQAWARAARGELDDLPAATPSAVQRSAPAAPRTHVAVGETRTGDATVQRPSPIQSRRTAAVGTSEAEVILHAMGKFDGPEPGKAVAADPLDLGTFCGRVGNLYVKHGLSPPFELRNTAAAWLADGIELSHCLDMVEQHLRDHAASCRSGSGDRWFSWLDKRIRHSWSCLHPDLVSDRVRDRSPLI